MHEYQILLKNNENHAPLDYERNKYKDKIIFDFTTDNLLLWGNICIAIFFFIFLFYCLSLV